MSSILTNNSAMVALQTLQSINKDLSMTQNEISTGKTIGSARDNSAIWAISQTMQSDVAGFNAISEALSLGGSTVAVARNGAESITGLLTEMKDKVVAAQEANDDDRTKIQTDIGALRDQINAITSAAQFNGVNLLQGSASYEVLSSLDRDTTGNVTASQITVGRQDLGTASGAVGTTAVDNAGDLITGTNTGTPLAGNAAASSVLTITDAGVTDGASYSVTLTGGGAADIGTTPLVFTYVATASDTAADVVTALTAEITAGLTDAGATTTTVAGDTGAGTVTIGVAGSAAAADTIQEDTRG
ncbi:MAG: flagellin, partial [Pseudomonadota bacterium]